MCKIDVHILRALHIEMSMHSGAVYRDQCD